MKYQTYKNYKLPITINPLEYGKLLKQINNIFIIQVKLTTLVIITQFNDFNAVEFYKEGNLIYNYRDHKIDDSTFIRSLENRKYTFKNNKLINVQINKSILVNRNLVSLTKLNYKDSILINKLGIRHYRSGARNILSGLKTFSVISRNFSDKPKNFYRNSWNSVYFNLDNQIFSVKLLEFYFEKFWITISPKILEGCHVFILLKFQFEDGNIHTIGKLIRIDHNNYKTFITQIQNYIEGMGDYYNQSAFKRIIFSYGFKRGEISENLSSSEIKLINFKDMKLPISIDPNDFGKVINKSSITEGNIYTIQDKLGRVIIFKEFEKENLLSYFKNSQLILEFKDIKFEENKILRKLGNRNLYFENGNKVLETTQLITPFISKLKKDKVEINNIITLDIETYGNSELIPYLISFYDGINSYSFYLADYNSIDEMMEACFKVLFVRKYNNYNVYIHNLTKFDVYFLLKYLVKHVSVNPLIHRGRIIQLKIHFGENNKYIINFKDSYLILLASLEKLGKSFGVQSRKSIFPHKFVNENNLDYIGSVPTIEYFFKLSNNVYESYYCSFENNWNLRTEAIKYCEIDCISLYQIILKFNGLIFTQFSKNIHRYPTLPSLAFSIFRSCFMDEENIPKLTGNIEKDIRQSYTGGSTDMFIPYGENIKCYDVNSLYPSVMLNNQMPVGKPIKFIGDIFKFEKDVLGFFKVQVNCPKDILHPIIQIKHKIKNSIKTISPAGSWSMWIFSEEMINAMKYGYTFKILEGYKFNKSIIFKTYVEFLYNLRTLYDRSHPLNLIAKILLNSLYGRFGMNEITLKYEIVSKSEFKEIENKNIEAIWDSIELDEFILVGLAVEVEEESSNISIGVASAITAYARIFMSQFKNNSKIRLFYTDTDSIYTDSKIDSNLIDPKILGKLKLENVCKEAVFLAPKVYCLETDKNETIYKVKGLKHEIELTMKDFENLLNKDSFLKKSQIKWRRSFTNAHIELLEQVYTLKVTDNKRKLIYENGKLIKTIPYIINKDKQILNK